MTNYVQDYLQTLPSKTKQVRWLEETIGSLSETTKMPGHSFSIPAGLTCKTGSKLLNVEGSICSDCYAMKGRYVFPIVRKAQDKRLFMSQDKDWHLYISELIRLRNGSDGYFRWFDSGDLQSIDMLHQICMVAEALPKTKFWLPTKERAMVHEYKKSHSIPPNLIIRISDVMIGTAAAPSWHKHVSGVTTDKNDKHICPAFKNQGKCGDCRKCWDGRVKRVNYLLH